MKKLSCTQCIATKQMRESEYCTKTIVEYDGQLIPECFVKLMKLDQPDRNYLTCQTYNLGLYQICKTCPLSCSQNPNKKTPIEELLSLVAPLFGADSNKQDVIKKSVEKLNAPEFSDIKNSFEVISTVIKDVMGGKIIGDVAKIKLESESAKLKDKFESLIKDGKISEVEANKIRQDINNNVNIKKIKDILNEVKK